LFSQRSKDSRRFDLSAVTLYVLGRATMESAITEPRGTGGLTLAYNWFEEIDGAYFSYGGADDRLLDSDTLPEPVLDEMRNEAQRFGKEPQRAAYLFDHARSSEAIRRAAESESLEAAVNRHVTEARVDLPFGRIVLVVSGKWPALGAELLSALANPVLIAAALADRSLIAAELLASLLQHAPPAFDESGSWSGSFVVRLLLHAFEIWCIELIRNEVMGSGDVTKVDVADLSHLVSMEVTEILRVSIERSDGTRLLLEWLAHLVKSMLSSLTAPWADRRSNVIRSAPVQALTEAVAAGLRGTPLSEPQSVWDLFGGSSVVLGVDRANPKVSRQDLPRWDDFRGEGDAMVPIAVSVLLARDDGRISDCARQLVTWIRLAFMWLEDEPDLHLHTLVERSSGELQRILAFPLSKVPQPDAALSSLWEDANWRRTRARFGAPEASAKLIQSCAAVVHLGVHLIRWLPAGSDTAQDAKDVASRLADMIDEARYTLPELGLASWSEMVGTLAGAMAVHKLLEDGASCHAFLSRYVGDDDALAAAVVGALANGASRSNLASGLRDNGEDPSDLKERWMRWNDRFARDGQGALSPFASRLAEIANGSAMEKE
jgi:hypothetical protein